jgi:hypothetical protein
MSYQYYTEDLLKVIPESDIEVFDYETDTDPAVRAKLEKINNANFGNVYRVWKVSFKRGDVYLCQLTPAKETISEIRIYKDKQWTLLFLSEGHYSNDSELYKACVHHTSLQK